MKALLGTSEGIALLNSCYIGSWPAAVSCILTVRTLSIDDDIVAGDSEKLALQSLFCCMRAAALRLRPKTGRRYSKSAPRLPEYHTARKQRSSNIS